jgi:hypothetical protein
LSRLELQALRGLAEGRTVDVPSPQRVRVLANGNGR